MAPDHYLSQHMVRTHVRNMAQKVDAHPTLEAVGRAVRAGMRPGLNRSLTGRSIQRNGTLNFVC